MATDSIKGKINFQELVSTGTIIEVSPYEANDDDIDEVSNEEYTQELMKHVNLNCIGDFDDEDEYDSKDPFEVIESKMEDIFDNGGIKKRILREGYGNKPEEKCIVKVHYNAYLEYSEEPFDCTYARKKPQIFVIGNGEVLPGLDISVQSMKLNEKSQFLVKPYLAYGTYGCLGRIPGEATVLFQIELLEIIESAASMNFENLPEEKKNLFEEVYKYCMAQCAKGKDLFNRNIGSAVKEYNMAVSALEYARLENYEDQLKQEELLYKLYSNLIVCYTKLEEPKKACINFNKIHEMSKGTDLKISAKIYYNNAKCLRMLGDYGLAKVRLQKAYEIEPRNPDILNEFRVLDEEAKKYKEKERKLASGFSGTDAKKRE